VARLNILLSAYACEPDKGSEPGVGWNWAINLSKLFNVYVITRTNNKGRIEEYLISHPNQYLHFFYHDRSKILMIIKKKVPLGIFIYYRLWQRDILKIAKSIVHEYDIDIIHHITFNEFRTPGFLYKINRPFVWGPIGGGQSYNARTKEAYFKKVDIVKEILRNSINFYYIKFSKNIIQAIRESAAILIADQTTEKIMPKVRKYYRLLETAYNPDRNTIKSTYLKQQNINLLWVGGIIPRKGLKVLIDALGESDFNCYHLIIIGDGKDKSLIEKLVKKYGLDDKVTFKGNLSYAEVNDQYDSADLFIFTSLRDTSGNVVLEAMSHGLPVIAFNHHGVGEIVTSSTGELIDITNYAQMKKSLIDNIKKYYKNRLLIEVKGNAGRKRVESEYTWNGNLKFIQSVYQSIIESRI
jgi:glycosyltransferase involved in cell wall biosynthesis